MRALYIGHQFVGFLAFFGAKGIAFGGVTERDYKANGTVEVADAADLLIIKPGLRTLSARSRLTVTITL